MLHLASWLDFGPASPVAFLQSCLRTTQGSEIKVERGIFPLDLAAVHRRVGTGATAPSTGMLPGTRAGGPRLARQPPRPRGARSAPPRGGSAGGRMRVGSAGRSSLLPPTTETCQGASSPLHPPFYFFPRLPNLTVNAACLTLCGVATPQQPVTVSKAMSRLGVGRGSRLLFLPQLRQSAASPAPRPRRGGMLQLCRCGTESCRPSQLRSEG